MLQLLINTCLLALMQALIPNHWLPLAALSRSENWTRQRLELMACICACAHVMGTLLLGISFGIAGTKLSHTYETYLHLAAPIVLILFGIAYFLVANKNERRDESYEQEKRTGKAWMVGIFLMMLLSPCLEVHDLFIAAADYGFNNILLLAMFYAMVNISGVLLITFLASKWSGRIYAKHGNTRQKKITALLLVLVGAASFFIH
ncbi:hypothetical protein GWC95_04740 [Sediminibacterium roseum]|uniref:Cytochrome C biogenesis protein transmembrane region n=1 Tax=Sediminibacterium roseum TaxID=1978412 RepID=A0ABW9ZSE2_9BACT|nr:hypothetical protein [Sediminibacterium roseum]NCI49219.1 hypothetical protein [Sediminibacterium roseum]